MITSIAYFCGLVCLGCGGVALSVLAMWGAAEVVLSVQDRIARIFKVQPALLKYLRNYDAINAELERRDEK